MNRYVPGPGTSALSVIVRWASFLAVLLSSIVSAVAAVESGAVLREAIRQRLEQAGLPVHLAIEGQEIYASSALPAFYEERLFQPAWVDQHGPLRRAHELLDELRQADREGLRPQDYHLASIEELLERPAGGNTKGGHPLLAELDLLLTDAFLVYGSHLVSGRIHPETFDAEWIAVRRERDMVQVLQAALDSGRVRQALQDLLPDAEGYARLRDALGRYRKLASAGGWPAVSPGPTLRLGDVGPRVEELRLRLQVEEYAALQGDAPDFDQDLEQAVRRFQARHGLDPDGAVGPHTLQALNGTAVDRVRQIELNLERWRWLPEKLGERYILVNIPDFSLLVMDEGEVGLAMSVIVGRNYRRTPVFSDIMRYLVLNPRWEVPRKLAVQDKLPLIRKDSSYLAEQGFKIYRDWADGGEEIDPTTVDWNALGLHDFPYRLTQMPGPLNALGRIKFMFPNRFNVYLHDTPARELFARAERDLSSGCIRVERPMELAAYLLRGSETWPPEALQGALDRGLETTVSLPRGIAVHILYWTAWVDADGTVQFRRDLYDRDRKLDRALKLPPPGD